MPTDVQDSLNEGKEDLTTKSIGVDAAERSLMAKLEKVQQEKKALANRKMEKEKDLKQDKSGYTLVEPQGTLTEMLQQNFQSDTTMTPHGSKKTAKRDNQTTAEEQEEWQVTPTP